MSQAGPWGRCTPRWSVATPHWAAGIQFTAGLPASSATVFVGPPFAARGPSLGFATSTLSVGFLAKAHPADFPRRLWPPDVKSIAQSGPEGAAFRARIDEVMVTSEKAPLTPPPSAVAVGAWAVTAFRTMVDAV